MQNDHCLLSLSHQLDFVIDQLCDDGILGVRVANERYIVLPDDVIERVLVCVEKLIHVASD